MEDCIFCRIARGELGDKIYEDDFMFIIKDISPQAKIHYLLIPKEHYTSLSDLNDIRAFILGKCLLKLKDLEEELGIASGYRVVTNVGSDAGQTVKHLHLHILSGEVLSDRMA